MSDVSSKRWLGQTPHLYEHLSSIGDVSLRARACTELIDAVWEQVMPKVAEIRRQAIRALSSEGVSDTEIAARVGVNRQRVAQIRNE